MCMKNHSILQCMREGMAPAKIMVPIHHTVPEFLIFSDFQELFPTFRKPMAHISHCMHYYTYYTFIQIINITKDLIITMNSKFQKDEYHTAG